MEYTKDITLDILYANQKKKTKKSKKGVDKWGLVW